MPQEIERPAQEVVRIVEKGEVFFESPTLDLDLLLAQAQAGVDANDLYQADVWLNRFHLLLQEKYQREDITSQDAWIICRATQMGMEELKKNLPASVMLVKSMDSTS